MIDEKTIQEIIAACTSDARLFSIIEDLKTKTKEERFVIRKKASIILSKVNGIEKEALKFYYIITEDGVIEEILRRLKRGKT
ncbi:hypothetical protein OSSY52_01650 [Tepiditoga spiralis]|uniref:Uncharacterized protein n=1 Tax=Tepiditoga spiralis TaxID=2108365 RepID=A0A7G1G4S9_9BACT|nr:hypothetical protein [Tepiditoga spiralis]BBE30024.1 hypothetical protein OSSY52_01650 [Tepiditoga spiralis]